MNTRVYYRKEPPPACKYCGETMPYWVVGQEDKDACHTTCHAKALAEKSMDAVANKMRKYLESKQ